MMKKVLAAALLAGMVAFTGVSDAAMMGNGNGNGTGMMGGGSGPFSTANGSFGMMNGMAGSPVVGDDGTAYLITYDSTAAQGTTPGSNVFQSKLMSIDMAGTMTSLTLNGIVSRPVLAEGYLFSSASMTDMADFMLSGDFRTGQGSTQSVVYAVPLHFSASTKPMALAIDGGFASVPVVAQNHIYIVGSDFGNAMMGGNNTFSAMYGNYDFNNAGTAKSYMYIFNFDGSLVSKTLIQ